MKLLFFSCLLVLSSITQAQNCNDSIRIGEATFYGGVAGSSGGNCSLPVAANDTMHCALNNTDYDNSNGCGAWVRVEGALGSAFVKVVDRCPECAPGDIDLTIQAFAQIDNTINGRVPVTWRFVPAPVSNPSIKINFKSGSSVFWTAIQFRDIDHAISKMEYEMNGSWVNVDRALFNFFIEPAGIPSPMKLRVTSAVGEELIFDNVPINTATDFNTLQQFSTPAGCSGSGSGLPIELEDFSVDETLSGLAFRWTTTTELNNKGFELQQSSDGLDWQPLTFVDGNGTTTERHDYFYAHKNKPLGKVYFRLKQIDFDNSFKLSQVISLTILKSGENALPVYPNPSTGQFTIEVENLKRISVFDFLGKMVFTKEIASLNRLHQIDLSLLPEGSYILHSVAGKSRYSNRILIK